MNKMDAAAAAHAMTGLLASYEETKQGLNRKLAQLEKELEPPKERLKIAETKHEWDELRKQMNLSSWRRTP